MGLLWFASWLWRCVSIYVGQNDSNVENRENNWNSFVHRKETFSQKVSLISRLKGAELGIFKIEKALSLAAHSQLSPADICKLVRDNEYVNARFRIFVLYNRKSSAIAGVTHSWEFVLSRWNVSFSTTARFLSLFLFFWPVPMSLRSL